MKRRSKAKPRVTQLYSVEMTQLDRIEFTQAERNQLLAYIRARVDDGWYYGSLAQFNAREKRILKKLNSQYAFRDT